MDIMKLIYYGFGGFIGFICGTIINLILYLVERAGHPIISNLPKKFGAVGYYLGEITNYLPLMGVALGLVMVKWLFKEQWESQEKE